MWNPVYGHLSFPSLVVVKFVMTKDGLVCPLKSCRRGGGGEGRFPLPTVFRASRPVVLFLRVITPGLFAVGQAAYGAST